MAKKAVYIQPGEAIDFVNSTDSAIPANTVVLVGNHIGVSGGEIPPGCTGSLHMCGIFEIPKKSNVTIAVGDDITFTDGEGIDKATDVVMGYAVEAAASTADSVKVKLLG